MNKLLRKKYIAIAKEPIHIGQKSDAGREKRSFTSGIAKDIDGLPIIPASSLKGCIRAYSSGEFGFKECDGKGLHCPQPHKCPSCSIFGFTNYHHGRSFASLIRFSSAFLLFVPIKVNNELLWITSLRRLVESGIIKEGQSSYGIGEEIGSRHLEDLKSFFHESLGPDVELIEKINDYLKQKVDTKAWGNHSSELNEICKKSFIVNEAVFSSCANQFTGSRTSISIDPKSQRTREGALFQIKHINRRSVLAFDVVYLNPASHGIVSFINEKSGKKEELSATFHQVDQIIKSGFEKIEYFGIGGKRSRGYGKMKIREVSNYSDVIADENKLEIRNLERPSVFISYSWKDIKIARRLASDLTSEGMEVWLDQYKILVGDSIPRKVEEGLGDSDFVVMLISKHSADSDWVKDEIESTIMREKEEGIRPILLPAEIESNSSNVIHGLLKSRKKAVLNPKYDDGFQELVESIWGHFRRRRN